MIALCSITGVFRSVKTKKLGVNCGFFQTLCGVFLFFKEKTTDDQRSPAVY